MLAVFHVPEDTGPPTDPGAALTRRDSLGFVSTIDQIEGDVDPDTLGDWTTDLGDFSGQLTINGDGAMTVSVDTVEYDRWGHSGDLDGNTGWTIELNIRIDSVGAAGGDVGVFDVVSRTTTRSPWFYVRPDGIGYRTAGADQGLLHAKDMMDGQFHTVRMATVSGEDHTIWIDGALAATWAGNDYMADIAIFLGRNGTDTVDDGTVTIDYIRFDTSGAYAPGVASSATAGTVIYWK